MTKSDRTYILGAVYAAATSFFYCTTWWFSVKLPRYYPLENAWKWTKEKGVPSQGWYGMQAWAFLAAAVVTLIVYVVLKTAVKNDKQLPPGQTKLIGLTTTAAIIIFLACMLHHEFTKWGII